MSSTPMATSDAKGTIKPRPGLAAVHWSDLPIDMLGTVCSRLTGLGRIGFAATCNSWRAAAVASRNLAPSSLPWFLYSGDNDKLKKRSLYCPEYNSVLSISLRVETADQHVVGFHDGGWVAVLGNDLQLVIGNLFSGIEVALSMKQKEIDFCGHHRGPNVIRKIIFSESPTSTGCILAAITHFFGLALCAVGYPNCGWTTKQVGIGMLVDITFCNGQLYGLMADEEIVKFEIDVNKDRSFMINFDAHWLPVLGRGVPSSYPSNIIELHGKVALVARARYNHEPTFKVYELSDVATKPFVYKWQELTSLGEHALILGQRWSKTVYVPQGGRGFVQRNHIYTDGVVYSMILDHVYHMHNKGEGLQMIKSAESYAAGGPQSGIWLPTPDF